MNLKDYVTRTILGIYTPTFFFPAQVLEGFRSMLETKRIEHE